MGVVSDICTAMSFAMSPITRIWPAMNACIVACWLFAKKTDLAVAKSVISVASGSSRWPWESRGRPDVLSR